MTTRNVGLVASVALAALLGFPSTKARAAGDREPGPPQEAIDACANQGDGATCPMSRHGRALQGICGKGMHGVETIACMPAPPPETIEACAKLNEGAACEVS